MDTKEFSRTDLFGDSLVQMWGRRSLSIGFVLAASIAFTVSLPILLPVAFGLGVVRKELRAGWRTVILIALILVCESIGIVTSFGLWVREVLRRTPDRERYLRENFALQCWWGSTMARLGMALFKVRIRIQDPFQKTERPIFLFVRHASFVDTLIPVLLISSPHRIRLRYVLKRELLWDPCLDIVGNRLLNYFVQRGSEDSGDESRSIARLAADLEPDEGVLIFPEGTRFSRARRSRLIEKYAKRHATEKHRQATALNHVLPPKLGGVLALLENNPGADVVFCAHGGLEGAFNLGSILNGAIVGRTVNVTFWRVAFEKIPLSRPERIAWLAGEWEKVDAFVGENCGKEC